MSAPTTTAASYDRDDNVTLPPTNRSALRRAVALLDIDGRQVAAAIAFGVLCLGSAVALAATSAWLIVRASQMPPVLYLQIAVVSVRAFGIGRGLFRYLERIASHRVGIYGMATLRTRIYALLASGRTAAVASLRRGDLLARVGGDVDAIGDLIVRGLIPMVVAIIVSLGSVLLVGAFLPSAGLVLAACLVLAGIVGPLLSVRSAREAENQSAAARADVSSGALTLIDSGGELQVRGAATRAFAFLAGAENRLYRANERAARPAALGAGLNTLAVGLAVLGALLLAIPAHDGGLLTSTELGVVVLTPLAAFEAAGALPAAAVQVFRSRAAAQRIMALLDDAADHSPEPDGQPPAAPHELKAAGLACGWPGQPPVVHGLDLTIERGKAVAIVGSSGCGKTTSLLTLAGLLAPEAGSVTCDGQPLSGLRRADAAHIVAYTAEDAHIFATTVLENLRVARGDLNAEQAAEALRTAGLAGWLDTLPDGLDTMLGPDGATISGGERRRLLLARALVTPAPFLLLDEPAEHLDADGADALVAHLLGLAHSERRGIVVVTHRLTPLAGADEVLLLRDGQVAARGTHAELLRVEPAYAALLAQESSA